jgi:hypothetical protein
LEPQYVPSSKYLLDLGQNQRRAIKDTRQDGKTVDELSYYEIHAAYLLPSGTRLTNSARNLRDATQILERALYASMPLYFEARNF